ncbi:hypothetical protein FGG08_000788 [Glutinoglossum americanum]|uniref:Uncharacterized protein n=1 Tax=Glutinoglossum americanum TaxID=1670608 RepID=A0A9P8I3B6_9PEZI|nr:hypothetical protein FGG08_000788 [Glutinoglossum americanum]
MTDHHFSPMADKPWAKKLHDTWRKQQDPQGLLSQTRHYSPEFVLRRFCSGRARSTGVFESRPWQAGREDDLLMIYNIEDKVIKEARWSESFGAVDVYGKIIDNFSKEAYTRDGKTCKVFDTLQSVDEKIFGGLGDPIWEIYQEEQNSGNGTITLSRYTINTLRKFLFLTSSVQNKDDIQHLVLNDDRMAEAKNKRRAFMKDKKLGHERELWLSNTAQILHNHHYDVASQAEISELDRDDYHANARERFVVFWRPSEKGDEFILTDNSFGCFEGGILGADAKLTIKMDVSEQARHVYTKDYMWHQLYVISPTLVIALCHGSLADKELIRQHRKRYGLGPSLLEKLPHVCPKNYYKDMTRDECRFLDNSWALPPEFASSFSARSYDGKSAMGVEKEILCFPILSLESDYVAKVNAVLLQSRSTPSPLESICVRPSAEHCLLRALSIYERIDWDKNSAVPQRRGYITLRKQLKLRNSYRRDTETTNSATSFSSAQSRSSGSGVPITPEENPFDRRSDPPSSPHSERIRQVRPHPGTRDPMPDQRPDTMASSDPNVGSKEQAQPRRPTYRSHHRTAAPEQLVPEQEQPRPSRPVSYHESFPTLNIDIPPSAEQSRSRGSSYYRDQKRMAAMGSSDGSKEQSRSRGSSFYRVEIPQTPNGHSSTPLDQSWHTVTSSSSFPDKHLTTNGARPEPSQPRPRPRKATLYREPDMTNTVQTGTTEEQAWPRPTPVYQIPVLAEQPSQNKERSPKKSLSYRDKQTAVNTEKTEPKPERPRLHHKTSLRDKHPTIITEQPEPSNEHPQRRGSIKRDKNTEIITEQPPSPGQLRYRRTSTCSDGRKITVKEQSQSARKQARRLSTHHDIPNKIVTELPEDTQEFPPHSKQPVSSDKPAKIVTDEPEAKRELPRPRRLPALNDHARVFDDSEATLETPARTRPRTSYREARRPPTIEDDSPVLVEPPLPMGDDQQGRANRVARAAEYVQTQQAFEPIPAPSAVEVNGFGITDSAQVPSDGNPRPTAATTTAATATLANTSQSPQRKERRYHMKPLPLETPPITSSVIVEVGNADDDLWWDDEGFVDGDGQDIDENRRSPTWSTRKPTVRFEKTSPKLFRKEGPQRKTSFANIGGRVQFLNRRQHRS